MLECLINYYSNGNQANFASKLGVPAQNINAWLKRNTFNAELIYSKCENVSADWLLSGDGDMIKQQHSVDSQISHKDNELLQACKLLVSNYQQRDKLFSQLDLLIKNIK